MVNQLTLPKKDNRLTLISERIAELRTLHSPMKAVQAENKRLRRGLQKDKDGKLRTNDSVTLFNFALHLLSSRDIRWQLPSVSQDNKNELRRNGVAERILQSVFYQNNVSRSQRGLPRAERATADSALEQAKIVVYKERRGDEFRIDPVDPTTVWERADDRGVVELNHQFVVSPRWLDDQARRHEGTGIWLAEEDHGITGQVEVNDYWSINADGSWRNTVLVAGASRFSNITSSPMQVMDRFVDESPWEVQYFGGESFPGRDIAYKGNSIFAANSRIYDDYHDFLEKVALHMDEVLTSPANVSTRGGTPIDPTFVDPTKGNRPAYTYDSTMGESAISFSQISPLDQSTRLIQDAFDQFIQAGGISKIFLGNLSFQLSGFAISELQELTLSSVGEVAIGLEFLWSRIGHWVLSSLSEQPSSSTTFTGFSASLTNQGYFSDEFKLPGDLPKNINVAAKLDIAMPSDLTERVSQARQLDPTSGPIWSRRNISEVLFAREIPDAQGNMDEIREQQIELLPQIQLMETYAALKTRLTKAEDEGDTLVVDVLNEQIEMIKQSVTGQGQATAQPQRQGTGALPQQVQPAEARGEGRAR